MDWLLAPIDPARAHEVGAFVSWHGRFMALAWGALAPMGVLIARFWKVTPSQDWPRELDNQLWWRSHLFFQWSAVTAFAAGLALILLNDQPTQVGQWHRIAGWLLAALAAAQIVIGLTRGSKGGPSEHQLRGDHYDMTPRRRAFEYAHKTLGYVLLLIGAFSVISGMWAANAPGWMWAGLAVWWAALAVTFIRLQAQGRSIDTYQAIWGPDPDLPGNQRAAIGWGVRRHGRDPAK